MKKRSEKQADLDKLKSELAKVSTVILTTFQGIKVDEDTKLRRAVQAAGLRPRRAFYFNYLLFLPILLARRLIDALGIELNSEAEINTPLVNRLLAAVFRCDIATAPWLRPPFGVSILMLAEKPGAAPARG